MISSHTASVAAPEFLPLRRPLMGKAGAASAEAPSKKDLLAALGQTSEGDAIGATEKASKALSKLDDASESSAGQDFASAIAPFLGNGRPGDAARSATGVAKDGDGFPVPAAGAAAVPEDEAGDGQVAATDGGWRNRQAGNNTVSPDLSAGRLNSQMLSVLLQHQAA